MTKQKSTKRALLMSGLALLMCVSMLIGSTLAWFTDSVTSAGNKIQSGTLKLDLELLDKESGKWNSIKEDKTAIFNYDLWEPGYTDVKILKIENEGTLALKWIAKFVSDEELSILADVIDVYVKPSANELTYPAERNLDGYEKVGTVAQFVNTIEKTTYGSLKADESAYLGIALKMQESADNDYQGLSLGAFDIMILATQDTVENDSFDNQYDKDATYSGIAIPADAVKVSTYEELKDAVISGGNIALVENIEVSATLDVAKDTQLYAVEGTILSFASTAQMKVKDGATLNLVNVAVDNGDTFGFDADGKFYIDDVDGRNADAIFDVSAGSHLIVGGASSISSVVGRNQAVVLANGTADDRATVTVRGTITKCAGTTGSIVCANKCTDVYIEEGAVLKNNVSYNSHNYGLIKVYQDSMLYINGGEITNNRYAGNGLIGFQSANAVMNGGIIKNNSYYKGADSVIDKGSYINNRNGLIYLHSNATFTINGGEIIDNNVSVNGTLDSKDSNVKLVINGGSVKNNICDGYDQFGTIPSMEHITVSKNADVTGDLWDWNTRQYIDVATLAE